MENGSILTLAPYRILPAKAGGHVGILYMHQHIGKLCQDHVVSTKDNDNSDMYSFDMHRIFATNPTRYVPFAYQRTLRSIGKKYDVGAIMCEHPYMAVSAHMLSKTLKVPWFLRSHNIESERFRSLGKPWWRVLARYEQWAMQKARGVLFVTDEDSEWAQQHFYLPQEKCHFIPFGCLLDETPPTNANAKTELAQLWNIDAGKKWIYFLGALDYKPNEEAVEYVINEIAPRLRAGENNYQILIGGKGLNTQLQARIQEQSEMKYVGFIPELNDFLNACDIMVNPVMTGGGIKTKAVEALGYNKIVVSSHSGSAGLHREACGNNLLVSEDNNWDAFCADIRTAMTVKAAIPASFYETYYWGNIAKKVVSIMQQP